MVRFPVGVRDFTLLQNVQTCSGFQLASYSGGKWGITSPRVNRPERKAGQSPPRSVEIKNECSYDTALSWSSWLKKAHLLYKCTINCKIKIFHPRNFTATTVNIFLVDYTNK
jgi:hypothetical protein